MSNAFHLIKKFWIFLFLIPSFLLVYRFIQNKQTEYNSNLLALKEIHQTELNKIAAIREDERKQHEENIKKLQDSLVAIQQKYDEANKRIDENQKKRTQKIVKKYSGDVKGLAEELSRATGFDVVVPEK